MFPGAHRADRKEFHLTDTQIGLLGSAFIWVYALVGLPLGRIADSASRKKLLAALFLFGRRYSIGCVGGQLWHAALFAHRRRCRRSGLRAGRNPVGLAIYFRRTSALASSHYSCSVFQSAAR